MKKLLFLLLIIIPLFIKGQACLGFTESEIKNKFNKKVFSSGYTDDGKVKYIYTDMIFGTMAYYFPTNSNYCTFCVQFPFTSEDRNYLVKYYNDIYVITSSYTWTAYTDNGFTIYISLIYDKETELYVFFYSNDKTSNYGR